MEKLTIVRMRVGPPERDGMLVSLSIGDPAEAVSRQSISMTLRLPVDFSHSAREIQAAALRRCTEILEGEVMLEHDDGACGCAGDGNVIPFRGRPATADGCRP